MENLNEHLRRCHQLGPLGIEKEGPQWQPKDDHEAGGRGEHPMTQGYSEYPVNRIPPGQESVKNWLELSEQEKELKKMSGSPSSYGASEAPIKGSHRKGAGLAAQITAAAVVQDGGVSSMQGQRSGEESYCYCYCYCRGFSDSEMVGCDGENRAREWFHLDCVGLTRAPAKNGKSPLNLGNSWALLSRFSKMVLR